VKEFGIKNAAKRKTEWDGMEHTYNSRPWDTEAEGSRFQVNLDYRVSWRRAWST
jgi:hypothetical protein